MNQTTNTLVGRRGPVGLYVCKVFSYPNYFKMTLKKSHTSESLILVEDLNTTLVENSDPYYIMLKMRLQMLMPYYIFGSHRQILIPITLQCVLMVDLNSL